MRRMYVALALGLLAMLGLSTVALAGSGWCRIDPIIEIDGQKGQIVVSGPREVRSLATGPTQIVISVPVDSDTRLIAVTPGFGHGQEVRFVESSSLSATPGGIEIDIAVYVPAMDNTVPIQVESSTLGVGPRSPASAIGTTNSWVTLSTILKY